jgi:hypothetical protein
VTRFIVSFAASALLLFGCKPKRAEAPATGTYGNLTNATTLPSPRAQTNFATAQPWTNGALAVIESELSPALLYHARGATLSFFTPVAPSGLGAPAHICFSTEQGPKIFKPGDIIDPAKMRESWFVVWWASASGWTNWDAPFLLTLQRRPSAIEFTTNGLQLKFKTAAGYAALMPLYGYDKSLPEKMQAHAFVQSREKKKRVLTWEWHKALPADPLARARYWTSALREFPIACDESFSVDRAHDSITIRQSFHWLSWNDDWNTKHLKLAPLSPVLALAIHEKFPAEFSAKPFDMEYPTLFGPLYGVQDADDITVTLPVLGNVHQTLGGSSGTHWKNAPCHDAWYAAHSSGNWDAARAAWPALREQFMAASASDWVGFGSVMTSPFEQAANARGAARLAYRLGDADTYALACSKFARAWVQVIAQQHAAEYIRGHQPWHEMNSIAADAGATGLARRGWVLGADTAAVDRKFISEDARLVNEESRPKLRPPAKIERLIPGAPATSFLPEAPGDGFTQHAIFVLEPTLSGSSLVWPEWKTSTGASWNFGRVTSGTPTTAPHSKMRISPHARTLLW